ncbi:MAG: hypothetical protein NWF09_09055 [Candidatus Bathyarchaeota archaeon]|nr:hypothetical protein [Candidatus Bathyarchaeota archaeon]
MKKKTFKTKLTVFLTAEQHEFLMKLIAKGEAENESQAIRRCINIAMQKGG